MRYERCELPGFLVNRHMKETIHHVQGNEYFLTLQPVENIVN